MGKVCSRFVSAFEEGEQCFIRRTLVAQIVIKVDKFAQGSVVAGLCRLDRCGIEALRRRSRIAVKRGFTETPLPGQKPALITSCE